MSQESLERTGSPEDHTGSKREVKVCRIITRLNIGGATIVAIELTRGLARRGYETTLVAGCCDAADGDMSYLLSRSDRVRWIPEMSRSIQPWKNAQALWKLWRFLRAESPSIVHTHTAMAGCLGRGAAILAGVPIIVHSFEGNSLRHCFSPAISAIFLIIERLLALRTDAICVCALQQVNELSSELRVAPRSRFRVVPYGLDLAECLQLPLPVPAATIRVGWFGRLVDVKNIGLLLEIVTSLQQSKHRFEFHVAGDGPDRTLIEENLPRLAPRLVWHGWQRDITPLLATCDLVIQTSRNEGTPVAVIQGMAAGRPFLSTAVGGVVNMTSGQALSLTPGATWFNNAVLVEASAGAFARALDEFASSPTRIPEMGRAARVFVAGMHRKEASISNLDALYRDLLAQKLPHLQTGVNQVSR